MRNNRDTIMKKNLVVTAVFSALMCCTEVAAQGNILGLGTDSENTLSLAERIFKLEKKTEAISIYFNTHVSFQDRFNGDDSGASFVGRQLRFEMLGNITKHWGYRFRYRLNRPGVQQSDNFSNNIDFMMIRYKFNDRFELTAGKEGVALGGYQYDDNPIQVLEFCDWLTGIDGFHLGLQGTYNMTKNQALILSLHNANNDRTNKYYFEDKTIKSSHFPLGATACWSGSFFGGKLQTLWSYTLLSEVQNNLGHLVMTGTKLNMKKWQLILDYYGAWEDVDHHKIVSSDMTKALGTTTLARDTRYHSVLLDGCYQPTPHWNLTAGVRYETASSSADPAFTGYRTNIGYQAAVQWIPDLTQDARISLAYIGRTTKFTNSALDNYNLDRIELSLIYRIKAY